MCCFYSHSRVILWSWSSSSDRIFCVDMVLTYISLYRSSSSQHPVCIIYTHAYILKHLTYVHTHFVIRSLLHLVFYFFVSAFLLSVVLTRTSSWPRTSRLGRLISWWARGREKEESLTFFFFFLCHLSWSRYCSLLSLFFFFLKVFVYWWDCWLQRWYIYKHIRTWEKKKVGIIVQLSIGSR